MITPLSVRLSDPDAERVRQSHDRAIRELQALPGIQREVIRDVELNGTTTNVPTIVAHRLGRAPEHVKISAPRVAAANLVALTAGMVVDLALNDSSIDRSKVIKLGAFGYAVPIIVDVEVS